MPVAASHLLASPPPTPAREQPSRAWQIVNSRSRAAQIVLYGASSATIGWGTLDDWDSLSEDGWTALDEDGQSAAPRPVVAASQLLQGTP